MSLGSVKCQCTSSVVVIGELLMSAFAYVKQYFSSEGINRFHEVFREHKQRAARYEGFVSLRHLLPLGESRPNEVVTLLEFSDKTLMLRWRGSEDHAWIAAQYGRWWEKPPEMLLYSSEE
jgi:heme-degrading monooxygenase HmoA